MQRGDREPRQGRPRGFTGWLRSRRADAAQDYYRQWTHNEQQRDSLAPMPQDYQQYPEPSSSGAPVLGGIGLVGLAAAGGYTVWDGLQEVHTIPLFREVQGDNWAEVGVGFGLVALGLLSGFAGLRRSSR